ncbi:MAG: class I SAM-dependent methyltransferase [Clostridiales bacterium]|nr:class I SAM-dependent methyltransferase [Clostridiales bacterium]
MPIIPGLEGTFNTVCTKYDRWRPTYVKAVYDDIFKACPLNKASRALEVGIGTGQATSPILETGCQLTAVELGDQMAAFVREKFKEYPHFSVVHCPFQDYECQDNSFHLIYSASAFHWIPEEIGYQKVYHALKPGGVFARFANHPFKDKGREILHTEMQKVYARYGFPGPESQEYSEENARKRALIAEKYGFTDISYHLYRRTRTFTAAEYVQLLGTYSDHIALGEKLLPFAAEIQSVIEAHGGVITLYDTIDLQLARKPE